MHGSTYIQHHYIQQYPCAETCAYIHTYTYIQKNLYIHTYSNTHTHRGKMATKKHHIHTYIHTYIHTQIHTYTQVQGGYKECAVLFRTNRQSRVLEEEFVRCGVPYHLVGGTKFYERREVKDLIAYMRAIVNPHDSNSLLRIINVPSRGAVHFRVLIVLINGLCQYIFVS